MSERPAKINIGAFARGFCNSPATLVDDPETPIATRWWFILLHLPEARHTPIYSDFECAFKRVYKNGSQSEVEAAIDLNRLRFFFYLTLLNNAIGRAHINLWYAANAEKWAKKLIEKFEQTTPAMIDDTNRTYMPEKHPARVEHMWVN